MNNFNSTTNSNESRTSRTDAIPTTPSPIQRRRSAAKAQRLWRDHVCTTRNTWCDEDDKYLIYAIMMPWRASGWTEVANRITMAGKPRSSHACYQRFNMLRAANKTEEYMGVCGMRHLVKKGKEKNQGRQHLIDCHTRQEQDQKEKEEEEEKVNGSDDKYACAEGRAERKAAQDGDAGQQQEKVCSDANYDGNVRPITQVTSMIASPVTTILHEEREQSQQDEGFMRHAEPLLRRGVMFTLADVAAEAAAAASRGGTSSPI